ncbi:SAM-dependent methyltransferase [Clostridium sp. MCC353]|uniref:tRNA (adenine(22)-N(1))-methyltransferase n=1 Tax=Clostridium sp. MCC353 TaxID=2592646 RepID=UPI001C0170A1|nr:class I SAM-dependent methyltransferase [Clostridium sp. MCC353]MBT9777968.1 SAM-dependent methyltransferase [Clostridium sp. MCC353]
MKLSRRLEMVASFVEPGSRIADIGTDHAYVPIWLVEEKRAVSAIAMDVRPGPLERAQNHIKTYGMEGRIETRLSDGVSRLKPDEADTVIIAGMGGELVIHILEEGRHVWNSVKTWILSPQSELGKVRRYLEEQGFCIVKEDMTCEEGKYYTVMKVVRGSMFLEKEAYYLYGRYLAEHKNPVLKEFLEKETLLYQKVLEQLSLHETEANRGRKQEIIRHLEWIKEILDEM